MSLISVVHDVCAVVGVHKTDAIFANINTDRTMFEMVALANEMAERIATDTRDWTILRKDTAAIPLSPFIGDGIRASFDLPIDFRRILTNSNVWRSTSTMQPMRFIPDTDQWMQRRIANWSDAWGEWTIYGGLLHVQPILASGASVRFAYLDKNCVMHGGIPQERFTADTDTFRLPERILKLGMIWQWKANKGSPYAEDLGTYQDAIAWTMGTDSPSPILIGRLPISTTARVAYPFPVPTP